MTLQQLLDMVMLYYPHPNTNEQVITLVNDVQRRIFRTLYRLESFATYDLLAGLPFTEITYSPDTILKVVVNGVEYAPHSFEDDGGSRYWYVTDGKYLGIYPTPEESVEDGLIVFRYKEPKELTTDDLDIEPDFDKTWHKLLVMHVCRELASIDQRADMVNNFMADILSLEQDYKRSKRAKPHKIVNVYGGLGA